MFHLTTALDAASGVPLYEQLYESLAAEMRSGAIPAGTRMPGKRRLAAELSVSVNTVDAAYQILANEGYMEPRERSGFYVQEYLALPTRPEEVPPPVSAAPPEAAEPPVRFDLSTRGVDPGLFPFRTSQVRTTAMLVPLLLASGPGSEIQRPLAIVVIGGLVTSTALTLLLLPILYQRYGIEPSKERA